MVLFIHSLQLLSLGGNLITEIPDTVGLLYNLHALVLCDNLIEALPSSIARLVHLKSLLLHKNRLKHLPREIITLKNLTEVGSFIKLNRIAGELDLATYLPILITREKML